MSQTATPASQEVPKRSALVQQLLKDFGSSDEPDVESTLPKILKTGAIFARAGDIALDSADQLDTFDFWDEEIITTDVDPLVPAQKKRKNQVQPETSES